MLPSLKVYTEMGEFEICLDIDNAPETANYFKSVAETGGFNGTTIFRIVTAANAEMRHDAKIEVVQLGVKDLDSRFSKTLTHETTQQTGLSHKKWTVSAARFDIGQNYPSFFICMRDEPELDCGGKRHPDGQGFAAFGEIVKGFECVNFIYSMSEKQEFLTNEIKILLVKVSEKAE